MRIRQSLVTTFMRCPLQAKFSSVEGLPQRQHAKATFGTCIHHALDVYAQTGDPEEAVKVFKDVWEYPQKLGAVPDFWPKYMTYGSYRERGINLIRDYHEKIRWESREVIATEHRFLVPFGKHELEGTVDLIEERKSGNGRRLLRIVDLKTNAKAPTLIELQWNIQFTTYVYASLQKEFWTDNGPGYPGFPNGEELFARFEKMPRRAIWFQLMQNKEIDAGKREDEDFMRLYRVVNEIERAIDMDLYIPSISAESCPWCSFTDRCAVAIKTPTPDDEEEGWI